MIRVDNKVKNIYHMLCYSFNKDLLSEKQNTTVGNEAFDNIYNLFSVLLCLMLKKQIKKGIHRDYISETNEILSIRGKINLAETIKRNSLINKKIVCDYDEFSENNQLNKIIKTTATYLIKSSKIGKPTKNELKKCMIYFNKVDTIEIRAINWYSLRFDRNNNSYRNIISLCKMILQGLIVTDEKGRDKFREFLDETRISKIYEDFLREFFRKHYKFKAGSRKLYFNNKNNKYIPIMKTDISLEYENRMLIIDAKFYNHILREGYTPGRKTISNEHLYQILAYVDNQERIRNDKVYGMLLYAQTVNDPPVNIIDELNGHTIMVKTIDLNSDWSEIKGTLENIAEDFKNDSFEQEKVTTN